MKRLALIWPPVGAAFALMAATAAQAAEPRTLLKGAAMLVAQGTFECSVAGGGGKRICDDIPVVVLFNGAQCLTLLPYHDLHIGTNKSNAVVVWRLIAPPGYTFAANGIKLLPAGGVDPSKVWESPLPVGGDRFRWKMKVGAPKGSFGHEAHVLAPDGKTECVAADPVISSDAN
jgi:hypothetical protein